MKTLRFLLPLLTAMTLFLPSCTSEESADAGDLIATVPSDASTVVVANVKALLEKSGCKVDGSKITPSQAVLDKLGKEKNAGYARIFFNGESGVDPSVAILFRVGYNTYITGQADDPSKFKASVEKEFGSKFSTEEGIDIAGNVAVADNRFWVCMDQSTIDARDIRHFITLDKTQSFLSNPYADHLCKIESDVEGWGNIGGLLNTANVDFQQRATLQVALQTLFEDPSSVTLSLDFLNGKAEFKASVINSKGNPAKYLLPTAKVDMNAISSIGGTADAVAALAIPHKLIEMMQKDAGAKGPSVLGVYLQALSSLDGTTAVAFGADASALRGVVMTDGKNTQQLATFLNGMGVQTTVDGKMLRLTRGNLTGQSQVADIAAPLKGSVGGISTSVPTELGGGMAAKATSGSLTLHAAGNSLTINVTLTTADTKKNFLETILEK